MTPNSIPDRALRAVLTLAFLWFGLTKLTGTQGTVALYEAIGFGQWPRFVTGSVETLGALGLWRRGLIGASAAALTLTMLVGLSAMVIFVGGPFWHLLLLAILSAIVAWTWRGDLSALTSQGDRR